ncbi:MAG: hypothetical protein JSV43_01770 [Methanobacteriota archaeon]|nr:MAG: hypothetical protein JSV43_01770 [Euryarchaeota archaeon]
MTSKLEDEVGLLQRHVHMLKAIMENQPIGIIRLSELLKYPQHKVRYSLRILEQEGLIRPSPDGAMTTEKLQEFLDHLKKILDSTTSTVKELRASL